MGVMNLTRLSDDELLASTPRRPEAFGEFYAGGVDEVTYTYADGSEQRLPAHDTSSSSARSTAGPSACRGSTTASRSR